MSSAPLTKLPTKDYLRWVVEKPHELNAIIRKLEALTNLDIVVRTAKGLVKVPVQFAGDNAYADISAVLQTTAAVAEDGEDETGGDVFGPHSAVVDHIAVFANSTGKRIRDSGVSINNIGGSSDFTVAIRSSDQVIPNATFTVVELESATVNETGIWNISDPTRFTISNAGLYMFTGRVTYDPHTTGQRYIQLYKNGAGTDALENRNAISNGVLDTYMSVAWIERLAAGDYIETYAYQNSGGNLDLYNTTMRCIRIGD